MTKNILILITLLITQSNLIYCSEPQTKSDADSKRSSPASQILSPCAFPEEIAALTKVATDDLHNGYLPLTYFAREYIKAKQRKLEEIKKTLIYNIEKLIKDGHDVDLKDGFNRSFAYYSKKDLSLKALYLNIDFDKLDERSQNIAHQIAAHLAKEINQFFIILNDLYKGNNFKEYLLELENGQAFLISQDSIKEIIHHKTKRFKRYYADLVI